ncbi:VWA domain-containing protein, partial [Nocardia fluminea]
PPPGSIAGCQQMINLPPRRRVTASTFLGAALARLGPDIDRVAVCASADGRPFKQIRGLHLRVIDTATGTDLARFDITAGPETALLAGELYRRQGTWKFRAVGQGWASGLAGLATDFGIAIDETDSTANAQAVVAQSGRAPALRPGIVTPPPRISAGENFLPLDMRKRLFTRKHLLVEILAKCGMNCATARVVLVLDCSGSMINLYQKKVIHRAVERVAAVAAQLDDNAQMQAWVFGENPARLPDLAIAELPQWISLHVRSGELPQFRTFPLQPGQVDMSAVGVVNEEHKVIAEVRSFVAVTPTDVPTLVLFFSDGGIYRDAEIEQQLRDAADEPIFWQFIGLGTTNGYGVLERLDTMIGRRVDNVGFFAVDDLDRLTDTDLYSRLLQEFPSWIASARQASILR